jgi:hypothetical protein
MEKLPEEEKKNDLIKEVYERNLPGINKNDRSRASISERLKKELAKKSKEETQKEKETDELKKMKQPTKDIPKQASEQEASE